MRGGLPVETIEQVGDDRVLDVEVTSNRSDCLSHVGVAREIAALTNREFREQKTVATEVATPVNDVTSVRIEAPQLCPRYTAGVMGGLDSEVSAQTTNILLESARFDPLSVRRTARALAMKSDSSYRFERGIDPTLPERASRRAAQLIVEIAGGELLAGVASAG